MPKNPQEFADLLGATLVGEVPDVGGGPFGMARLVPSFCFRAQKGGARLVQTTLELPG